MLTLHQISQPNDLAAATHRFERKINETDFREFWDLRGILEALPHIRLKDGYALDAYYVGDRSNAKMKLYAYVMDSTDEYCPGPEGIHQDPEDRFRRFDWSRLLLNKKKDEEETVPPPIPFKDGQVIVGTISYEAGETVPPLENYLDIDFTPEAVWEAVLLVIEAGSYLPHRWHGGYSRGLLVVDRQSLIRVCHERLDKSVWEPFLTDERIVPSVKMLSAEEAAVQYCHWSDWGGLSIKSIKVTRVGRSLEFKREKWETLIEYDCGLRF